jgi:hypothetical protein
MFLLHVFAVRLAAALRELGQRKASMTALKARADELQLQIDERSAARTAETAGEMKRLRIELKAKEAALREERERVQQLSQLVRLHAPVALLWMYLVDQCD